MVNIAGKSLTKSQKRAFRSFLDGKGLDADYVFSDRRLLRSSWSDYQESLVPSAKEPVKDDSPNPPETQKRRARGAGKVPAGEIYSIRLAPALAAALRSRAAADAKPVSEVVRLALQAYLATPSRLE